LSGKRIRTAVYGMYVAFAAAFVLSSAGSVIWGLFGAEAAPTTAPAGRACGAAIARLAQALDRGVAATSAARTDVDALARMRAALVPEWDAEADGAATCAEDPHGADAWAALLRLKRAEEGAVASRAAHTGSAHRELEAYLPR
jgi:hypothetical protein